MRITRLQGVSQGYSFSLGQGGGDLGSLFTNGEDGFLFGPFDAFERMFLISTGQTGNIAANNDPVGLNLDRHSWGSQSLASILADQSELIVNGNFDTNLSSWIDASTSPSVVTWSGGQAVFAADGIVNARLRQSITTVVGRTYRISYTGTVPIFVGTTAGASDILIGFAGGTRYFVAVGTTTWIGSSSTINGSTMDNVSVKLMPGRHMVQATTTMRPLWKSNSGKPNLTFDGTDDFLQTNYVVGSAGTAAVVFNSSATNSIALASGQGTLSKRFRIGLGTGGQPKLIFNDTTDIHISGSDRRNTNVMIIVTWDATGWNAYLDGATTPTQSAATVPNMDGTGGAYTLGAVEGGFTPFLNGTVYAALALNRRATAREVALISSQFRSTYP